VKGIWSRITARKRSEAIEHAVEESQMSPGERAFYDESYEDHAADLESEAHLGGINPNRLLEE
jgi:hypothetical protein